MGRPPPQILGTIPLSLRPWLYPTSVTPWLCQFKQLLQS